MRVIKKQQLSNFLIQTYCMKANVMSQFLHNQKNHYIGRVITMTFFEDFKRHISRA